MVSDGSLKFTVVLNDYHIMYHGFLQSTLRFFKEHHGFTVPNAWVIFLWCFCKTAEIKRGL